MPRAPKTCTRCNRQAVVGTARCPVHPYEQRESPEARGYGSGHRSRFRPGVLARDRTCVMPGCPAPATEADHYPLGRRELVALGLDPDDPQYGRGLCKRHHSSETARHQPGGFLREVY